MKKPFKVSVLVSAILVYNSVRLLIRVLLSDLNTILLRSTEYFNYDKRDQTRGYEVRIKLMRVAKKTGPTPASWLRIQPSGQFLAARVPYGYTLITIRLSDAQFFHTFVIIVKINNTM